MFKRDAEQFCFDELCNITQWGELSVTLNERYNSEARKRAIEDELRTMQLSDHLDEDGKEGPAFQKLARRIEKLVPQCPPGRNSDIDKRDYLVLCGPYDGLGKRADSSVSRFKQEIQNFLGRTRHG